MSSYNGSCNCVLGHQRGDWAWGPGYGSGHADGITKCYTIRHAVQVNIYYSHHHSELQGYFVVIRVLSCFNLLFFPSSGQCVVFVVKLWSSTFQGARRVPRYSPLAFHYTAYSVLLCEDIPVCNEDLQICSVFVLRVHRWQSDFV